MNAESASLGETGLLAAPKANFGRKEADAADQLLHRQGQGHQGDEETIPRPNRIRRLIGPFGERPFWRCCRESIGSN